MTLKYLIDILLTITSILHIGVIIPYGFTPEALPLIILGVIYSILALSILIKKRPSYLLIATIAGIGLTSAILSFPTPFFPIWHSITLIIFDIIIIPLCIKKMISDKNQ